MDSGAVFTGLQPNPNYLISPLRSACRLLPPQNCSDKKQFCPQSLKVSPFFTSSSFFSHNCPNLENKLFDFGGKFAMHFQRQPLLASYSKNLSTVHEAPLTSDVVYELADIDWDSLGFALMPTDFMYIMKCSCGQTFSKGLKAYRKQDGNILLFRFEENALRMRMGAERMCMPSPTIEQLVDVPPGKGSLYIRPLLMGSGAVLGLAPAPEYTFLIYVSPVGNYFKVEERLVAVDELLDADEVFCTGTAVVISPVGSITYHGERYKCIVWFFICSFPGNVLEVLAK
ncbi:hypothetical protein C3L33_18545, partial [Rhododendron williamsianum]